MRIDEAALGDWKKLYDMMEAVPDENAMQYFAPDQLIQIDTADGRTYYYESLPQGILTFDGEDGLNSFIRANYGREFGFTPDYILGMQDMLACSYDDPLPEDQKTILQQLGIPFQAGKTPVFFSAQPGFAACTPNGAEVNELTERFRLLGEVITYCEKSGIGPDTASPWIVFTLSGDGAVSREVRHDPPELMMDEFEPMEDVEQTVNAPRTAAEIAVEAFAIPFPIQDPSYERLRYPMYILLYDTSKRETVYMIDVNAGDPPGGAGAEALLRYIKEHGRPTKVRVRNIELATGLDGLSRAADIPVELTADIPGVNETVDEARSQIVRESVSTRS